MRRRKIIVGLIAAIIGAGSATAVSSCGSMRSYWGVESEYDFDDHHHKHKHHKPPKHHKHHHHHHHD
ncbi:MAG: hypothetical protein K2L49_09045 [Muribaculaceae bacterium]|nr:hypothetical protein [Muribaculaceae bacterium]